MLGFLLLSFVWLLSLSFSSFNFSLSLSVLMVCFFMLVFSMGELSFVGELSSLFSSFNNWSGLLVGLSIWVSALMFLVSLKYEYSNSLPKFFQGVVGLLLLIIIVFFITDHLLVLYVTFEFSLLPTLFLILKWGYQPERLQASLYFVMYTICASLPLLLMILYTNLSLFSFSMSFIYPFSVLGDGSCTYLYFLSFIAAFLVKVPMWGVHLWLPKAHVEAPVSGSMILAGILLKLGGYGLLKVLGLLWKLGSKVGNLVLSVNLWGALVVGLVCICVVDIKSLIAYSSVIHMGGMVVGLMSGSCIGALGGVLMMIAHGLSSPGMFAMANFNYEVSGSRNILLHKGLCSLHPVASLLWFCLLSANMAAPPSLNLAGEFLICVSILKLGFWLFLIIGAITFLAGAYNLYLYSSQLGNPSVLMHPGSPISSSSSLAFMLHCVPVFLCTLIMYLAVV